MRPRLHLLLLTLAMSATAQTGPPASKPPSLEVISVKQNNSGLNDGNVGLRADSVFAQDAPLTFVLGVAFRHQFAGGHMVGVPAWADTTRFDMVGRVAETDIPKLQHLNFEQHAEMRSALLKQILYDRFQLKTHIEVREGPVYALVAAKGSPKLKPVSDDAPKELVTPKGNHVSRGTMAVPGEIAGHIVPISSLVDTLMSAGDLDRPVIDRTGLTGKFDFSINWTPEQPSPNAGDTFVDDSLPSLFTAIQEQLGLKLEPSKGPIRTLVIDSIERPKEN